jgi:hypothetical protein
MPATANHAATAASAKATAYTFQQPPKSSPGNYRDPDALQQSKATNLMYDRRVVRGNTYAAQVLPLSAQAELQRAEKEAAVQQKKSKAQSVKKAKDAENASLRRPTTPEAVDGRKHMDIQTEQYLEELKDKPDEITTETQTDPMLDRPPTPQFIPFKTGRDMETQIQPGELFDFDTEVDPVLDVMVGKTLEQAMLEVLQEEEVELMRQQQMEFEQRRKEEVLESQRLEAAEKRKFEEKERRKRQEVARIRREKETREKLCARMYSKSFLTNLEHKVFARLQDEGWFHDGVEREVTLEFMPWLYQQMDKELDRHRKARQLVDELVRQTVGSQ